MATNEGPQMQQRSLNRAKLKVRTPRRKLQRGDAGKSPLEGVLSTEPLELPGTGGEMAFALQRGWMDG